MLLRWLFFLFLPPQARATSEGGLQTYEHQQEDQEEEEGAGDAVDDGGGDGVGDHG